MCVCTCVRVCVCACVRVCVCACVDTCVVGGQREIIVTVSIAVSSKLGDEVILLRSQKAAQLNKQASMHHHNDNDYMLCLYLYSNIRHT